MESDRGARIRFLNPVIPAARPSWARLASRVSSGRYFMIVTVQTIQRSQLDPIVSNRLLDRV